MTDTMRFRHADAKRAFHGAVDSGTVIEIGDMLFEDTDDFKPAADETWTTNLATTQANFADHFAGVAMTASADGETEDVTIATAGVFEYTCAAATFEVFDFVAPAKASGDALLSQEVVGVTASEAIGWAFQRYANNTTSVLVELLTKHARFSSVA